jgi:pSer/pThr/pTyr-binding forkhead associated (FHA) protein
MALQVTVMPLNFDGSATPVTRKFNKKEITLGRQSSNDIVLDGPEVSARHAKLSVGDAPPNKPATVFLTDLGSATGTHVGSTRLSAQAKVEVAPHERIRIGNFLIKSVVVADDQEQHEVRSDSNKNYDRKREEDMGSVSDFSAPSNSSGNSSGKGKGPAPVKEDGYERVVAIETAPSKGSMNSRQDGLGVVISGKVGSGFSGELNLTAVQLFRLSGKVTHNGRPLEGVRIEAGALGSAETDPDGMFRFLNVKEGTEYNLSASKGDFRISGLDSKGVVARDTDVAFSAIQLFTIRGKVTHNGKALVGVEVDGGPLGRTITGPDGAYVFKDVPEGTDFTLRVAKDGFLLQPGNGKEAAQPERKYQQAANL